ncbi:MAG TPA: asparagine synthase-related protein, partial [Bdellovibrionales bacterium]|nr:asparagine synthase-related protein [Bdellovibrionales bacterium]
MNFSGLVHEDRFPEGLRVHLLGLFTNADELRRRYGTRDSATHEELLAASYRARGSACVDELEGEYAFVVIDGRERIVLCGRDRLGLKPLYYRLRTQNGVKDLAFATTLASARAWPGFAPTPDLNALAFSLAEVHFDQSLTWYQNVSALPQAHALLWQDGRARIFRYWTPGLGKVLALANHGEYLEHAHELFRRAVGARLTELQGPVSVFLSGGLDSGLVAKLAEEKLRSEHHDRAALLHTHSAICRAGAADESAGIARTISGAAWRAHTLEVSPDNPILDIPEPGRLRDVTYAPHNFFGIPLLEDMQARDIHTVFSGYGGDDVFSPGLFAAEFLRRGRVVSAVGAVNELSYPGDNKLNVFWTHGVRPLLVGLRNRYMASALKRPVSSLLSPEFDQKAGISVAYNEYLDRNRASEGDLPRRNLYRKFFVRGG